jgi:hypothetical protein
LGRSRSIGLGSSSKFAWTAFRKAASITGLRIPVLPVTTKRGSKLVCPSICTRSRAVKGNALGFPMAWAPGRSATTTVANEPGLRVCRRLFAVAPSEKTERTVAAALGKTPRGSTTTTDTRARWRSYSSLASAPSM